jgi:FAD/FMN-containing dehydrogenase
MTQFVCLTVRREMATLNAGISRKEGEMAIQEDLVGIVGSEYVSDEPEILERYSRDYSFVTPRKPRCVVFPKNTEEVQGIVRYANEHMTPITPRSSGVSFYGAGIPSQGGIIVDLRRMNRILDVDPRNKKVKTEPGVTWSQIQDELQKKDLMVCNPLLPHPAKSVLTSAIEREPILISKSEYAETLLTTEIVLPNGEMFWTGSALGKGLRGRSFPEGIIPSTRVFTGAQGTLGIVTWANIKAEYLSKMDKLLFMPFDRIEDLIEPTYRIQRRMLGRECLALNDFNLAAILAQKWPEDFKSLRETLPRWTLILCLSGLHRLPAEKVAYEEEALMEVASELRFEPLHTVGGIPGLDGMILKMLRKPWPKDGYWKFRYKGACHDIFFHTTLNRVPEFTRAMDEVAVKYGYPTRDIGFYLQPIEYGRACFCQYGFHCDPEDGKDVARVRDLFLEASELAITMGGLFTTPYGPWADMVYRRTSTYTAVARILKDALDPNNIMNPGKLCF